MTDVAACVSTAIDLPEREVDEGPAIVTPRVRVIVVNYNSGGDLRRCLEALSRQTVSSFEVHVADNASTDGSLSDLPDDMQIRILHLGRNVGFAAANNTAATAAESPFLAFLNPDAFPEPDWLERLLAVADESPLVQLFGSLQLQAADPRKIDGAGDVYFCAGTAWRDRFGRELSEAALRAGFPAEVFGACAAAALIRTEWFEKLGGFDESYFCYFEDVDLSFRLRLYGGLVLQVQDAVVLHTGSATAGAGSDFVLYHTTRNQIWTFFKCMPAGLLVPLLPLHLALVAMKWWKASLEGRGHIVSEAVRDAMRGWRRISSQRRDLRRRRRASAMAIARSMTWSLSAFLERGGP